MRSLIHFILILLCGISPVASAGSDQSPTSISLQDILASMSEMQVVSGEFEQQKSIPILSRPFVSSGRFLSVKKQGLIWETEEPAPSMLIMTEGRMVQKVDGRTSEYQATGTAYDGLALLLPAILDGDEARLRSYFTVDARQVNSSWELELIPIAFSKSLSCRQLCLGIITMHYLEQMSRRPQLPEGFNDVDF
ncbi:outer membrane lipoprotein carrier protein LolA, partial [Endozoicomonas atrinae]|uniref:outer membrane lipoprotein carrier protein LolA n=1 Tax=Endozoicomonas atrinae TaxID=1333660 RepID=UPI001112D9E2